MTVHSMTTFQCLEKEELLKRNFITFTCYHHELENAYSKKILSKLSVTKKGNTTFFQTVAQKYEFASLCVKGGL